MMEEINNDIFNDIKKIEIDCPDCQCMEDDQYTCTICWCQGGNGKINIFRWLKDHPKYMEKS